MSNLDMNSILGAASLAITATAFICVSINTFFLVVRARERRLTVAAICIIATNVFAAIQLIVATVYVFAMENNVMTWIYAFIAPLTSLVSLIAHLEVCFALRTLTGVTLKFIRRVEIGLILFHFGMCHPAYTYGLLWSQNQSNSNYNVVLEKWSYCVYVWIILVIIVERTLEIMLVMYIHNINQRIAHLSVLERETKPARMRFMSAPIIMVLVTIMDLVGLGCYTYSSFQKSLNVDKKELDADHQYDQAVNVFLNQFSFALFAIRNILQSVLLVKARETHVKSNSSGISNQSRSKSKMSLNDLKS